jgi:hypothetical protein
VTPRGSVRSRRAGLAIGTARSWKRGAIRLGRESVARLAETSLSHLAAEAEEALAAEDTQRLRDMGLTVKNAASAEGGLVQEISGQLTLAAMVIDAARHSAPRAKETVS